jgi:hypothetical protein
MPGRLFIRTLAGTVPASDFFPLHGDGVDMVIYSNLSATIFQTLHISRGESGGGW